MSATAAAGVAAIAAALSLVVAGAALAYARRATLAAEGSKTAATRSAEAAETSAAQARRENDREDQRQREREEAEAAAARAREVEWRIETDLTANDYVFLLHNDGLGAARGVQLRPTYVTPGGEDGAQIVIEPGGSHRFLCIPPVGAPTPERLTVRWDDCPEGREMLLPPGRQIL